MGRHAAFVVMLSAGLLVAPTAQAELDAYDALGISLGVMFEGPALIAGGAMLYHAVKGERPATLALVAGYAAGATSVGFGTLVLAGIDNHDGVSLSLGISALAVGAIDLGFTVWANARPPAPRRAVAMTPLVARGGGGAALHWRW